MDEITPDFTSRILELDEVVWQSVRVEKYPLHTDYGIVHISKDFPQAIVRQVEKLYVFSSLDDLESNCREALSWYYETKIEVLA